MYGLDRSEEDDLIPLVLAVAEGDKEEEIVVVLAAGEKVRRSKAAKKRSCSEKGRTRGPKVVMFVLRASPPTSIKSLLIFNPLNPCSSSSWYTLLKPYTNN